MCKAEQLQRAMLALVWVDHGFALSSFVILGSGPESSSFPFFFAKPAVWAKGRRRLACFCCRWTRELKPLSMKRLEARPISDYAVDTNDACRNYQGA